MRHTIPTIDDEQAFAPEFGTGPMAFWIILVFSFMIHVPRSIDRGLK